MYVRIYGCTLIANMFAHGQLVVGALLGDVRAGRGGVVWCKCGARGATACCVGTGRCAMA